MSANIAIGIQDFSTLIENHYFMLINGFYKGMVGLWGQCYSDHKTKTFW